MGRAYKNRIARQLPRIQPSKWISDLKPCLEDLGSVFECPSSFADLRTKPLDTVGSLKLTRHPGGTINIECREGPHCRVISGELGSAEFALLFEYHDPPKGDWDDTVLGFEDQGNGLMKVTCLENDRGRNPSRQLQQKASFSSVFSGPDGEEVLRVKHREMPGRSALFRVSTVKSDYGMNNRANRLFQDSHRILIVEYSKVVADVAGPDAMDIWSDEVAPRHFNTLNVLHAGGHVKSYTADEINPEVRDIQIDLWMPLADAE